MRMLQLIGAILILFATPAFAGEGSAVWIVAQRSGEVRVLRNGMQPASVNVRAALAPGDVVATGANGRAMLTRGDDYVVVAPSSRLLLPKEEQQKGFTRLIQQVGTMLYKVRHTGVPHFAVETPILAAVVKGTSFTVIVEDDRAAVQVTEGLVEVSSATGSARRLVEKGMTVYIGRERPDAIIEMKPGAADVPGLDGDAVKIEGSGEVPLSAITDLTGGLVRATPTAPVVAVANTQSPAVVATPISEGSEPAIEVADSSAPTAAPVGGNGETAAPGLAEPVVGLAETATPAVIAPVADAVTAVTTPVVDTVATVTAPVIDTVTTVTAPVIDTVTTIAAPVIDTVTTVAAPVIDTVTTVTAPVIDTVTTVTAPVINTVTTVTAPVIDTATTVTAPVIDTVTAVAAPVVAPVVNTVTPVVAPVVEAVAPVVAPVVSTVTPIVAPVVNTVTPIVNTVTPVIAPVVAPLAPIVQPVVNTVPILGGLLRF